MMHEVKQATEGIDLLVAMIDASQGITREDRLAFQRTNRFSVPVYLVLNKIDRIARSALLPLLAQSRARENSLL